MNINKTMNSIGKAIIIFSVIDFLAGCNSKKVNEYTINMDRLALIATMELPLEFDTMYSWFHLSDNDGNDFYKYRISKLDLVVMEKGWIWDEPSIKYQEKGE